MKMAAILENGDVKQFLVKFFSLTQNREGHPFNIFCVPLVFH